MKDVSGKKQILVTVVSALVLSSPAGLLPDYVAGFLPQDPVAFAAPDRELPGRNDPSVLLNQAREYLERQRVMRQIEEDSAGRNAQVETEQQKPEESTAQISFLLTELQTDKSEVLQDSEISAITAPYIGKTVSLQDLYTVTEAINKLYNDKGYMVCRAYLPPQRIHNGVVQVRLLEGRTGLVTVKGLRHTKEGYVTRRIPLKPDTVANTAALNKKLQWFNGTNDMQLRVMVHAGEKPGTTDYEIMAYEPKKNQAVTVYTDNNGYETSGRWRQGLLYSIRSLTGQRDSLRMNYLRSKGTDMFGTGYSVPLNRRGTRLDVDYSTNSTEIVKGDLKDVGVKGHAYAGGLTLRHPLRVDQKRRDEVGLQYLHQKSQTDMGTKAGHYVKWVDDVRNTYVPYISFTHYGDSSIFYHKHGVAITNWNGASGNAGDYAGYQLNALYQKKYKRGQMFSGRLDAQFTGKDDISSADRFYIGGSGSVRGYEESFLGGSKGFSASLTYQAPLNKNQTLNAFTFFDYGRISGTGGADTDSTLYSTGLGLAAGYKDIYASLTLGIPLKRDFEFHKKPGHARLNFICSATF